MLVRLELPPTMHRYTYYRVWQKGGCHLNVRSEKKLLEKLNCLHNNPLKHWLVENPGERPWSRWRFYYPGDASVLPMDRMP